MKPLAEFLGFILPGAGIVPDTGSHKGRTVVAIRVHHLALVVVLSVTFGCPGDIRYQIRGAVNGTPADSAVQKPLEGVTVALMYPGGLKPMRIMATDERGKFETSVLLPRQLHEEMWLELRKQGFQPASIPLAAILREIHVRCVVSRRCEAARNCWEAEFDLEPDGSAQPRKSSRPPGGPG